MWWIYTLLILGVVASLIIAAPLKLSSKEGRKEEAESPCYTCLHWPECNGVDSESCKVVAAAKKEV